jgi:flagellin
MIINHSMSSLFANRQVGINEAGLQKSMEKLSSGEKINRAGDDSANLAVSEKMRAQIRGLNQASRNVSNGINFIQTTEANLQETTDVLQRIRELAVQASNGVYSDEDRMQIQVEVSQLVAEVDRIASTAQFNGFKMLTGRFAEEGVSFHIGANTDERVTVNIGSVTASSLGLKGAQGDESNVISVASTDEANVTIATIDEALKNVNKQRASLGATQNRMELAQKGINTYAENLQAAESRIRDTDFAETMVDYTKHQILSQSASAMLAQANTNASLALQLLK